MLKCSINDYPTRVIVSSEEDPEDSYLVDLVEYPIGEDENGNMQFNGSCLCRDFIYRWEPKLKHIDNKGRIFRCKHIRAARDQALNFLLPHLKKNDPNINESLQS